MSEPDPKVIAATLIIAIEQFFDAPTYETWQALHRVVKDLRPPVGGPGRYDERYPIRNEEIERKLYEIGTSIKDDLPDGWGFVLALASYGEGGATFYMSSVERAGAIKLLEELIEKMRGENPGG